MFHNLALYSWWVQWGGSWKDLICIFRVLEPELLLRIAYLAEGFHFQLCCRNVRTWLMLCILRVISSVHHNRRCFLVIMGIGKPVLPLLHWLEVTLEINYTTTTYSTLALIVWQLCIDPTNLSNYLVQNTCLGCVCCDSVLATDQDSARQSQQHRQACQQRHWQCDPAALRYRYCICACALMCSFFFIDIKCNCIPHSCNKYESCCWTLFLTCQPIINQIQSTKRDALLTLTTTHIEWVSSFLTAHQHIKGYFVPSRLLWK